MLIYLVAALEALVYLCAVPICAAFCVSTKDAPRFGAGVAAFGGRAALRRARKNSVKPKKRRKSAAARPLKLLRRLRGVRVALWGRLNLGDAAATALACGALRALAEALAATRAGRARVDVVPVFDGDAPQIVLAGMIRLRAGQIIAAAARGGADIVSGRISKWTDTRSKAS